MIQISLTDIGKSLHRALRGSKGSVRPRKNQGGSTSGAPLEILSLALMAACSLETPSDAGGEEDESGWPESDLLTPTAVAIPARIEAEAFVRYFEEGDVRDGDCGQGPVDQEYTEDPAGGGCNVAWTWEGEWLEYDIEALETGTFDIMLRIASHAPEMHGHVQLDGAVVGYFEGPNLGWHAYVDAPISGVQVRAGIHVLRVVFDTGLINFNYFDVVPSAAEE